MSNQPGEIWGTREFSFTHYNAPLVAITPIEESSDIANHLIYTQETNPLGADLRPDILHEADSAYGSESYVIETGSIRSLDEPIYEDNSTSLRSCWDINEETAKAQQLLTYVDFCLMSVHRLTSI
jgi:hypothetical protein